MRSRKINSLQLRKPKIYRFNHDDSRCTRRRSELTSLRTLERCDLSTLLTAKYSMVFFFRPLYTVFTPQSPGPNHRTDHRKAPKYQKSLALEPGPPRSWRIQGGSREGGVELNPSGAERGREGEGGLPSACRGRWPRRRGSCSWRRSRRSRRRRGSPLAAGEV